MPLRAACRQILPLFSLLGALASCVSSSAVPVSNVPITVAPEGFYTSSRVTAYYDAGTLIVRGEFSLVRGVILPPRSSVQVRIFNVNGRRDRQISARLEQAEKTYPGDPRSEATFSVKEKIPLTEIGRIEVAFE